ncbi:unnamed protein product [Knipowitschia caucasica]|uniref:Ig-like domain-containing protein n=1 Tax=Knipowitschia caucasica TaxID=637954 RepID=A0AAV2MGV4_KNICA
MDTQALLVLLLCSVYVSGASKCEYVPAFNISVGNLEALSGTCLLIPCTFTLAPVHENKIQLDKPVVAIWSKTHPYFGRTGEEKFFDSSDPDLSSPMTLTGDLRQRNCTTLFTEIHTNHSDKYYLRIENQGFKATAVCDPLQIHVRDSAWRPSVQISGSLREQQTVVISCSALTPCPDAPPVLSWSLQQTPAHSLLPNPDGTFNSSIQQSLLLSEEHHGLELLCSALYPVRGGHKAAKTTMTLTVDHSPKHTTVLVEGNTSVSLTLSCSSRAWPPDLSFSWFRLSPQGPQRVHEGDLYTINHTSPGRYFCQAKNQVGDQNSTVLTLGEPEDKSWWPWEPIIGGGVCFLVLTCVVVTIWCCVSKKRSTKKPESEEVQREEDHIHYGEVTFSKSKRPARAPPHREDPEEAVYSQVLVSASARPRPPPEECLYATVKKP